MACVQQRTAQEQRTQAAHRHFAMLQQQRIKCRARHDAHILRQRHADGRIGRDGSRLLRCPIRQQGRIAPVGVVERQARDHVPQLLRLHGLAGQYPADVVSRRRLRQPVKDIPPSVRRHDELHVGHGRELLL